MGKRNNADGVVGLPDRKTGSRADHLLNDRVSILWLIECRVWVDSSLSAYGCSIGQADVCAELQSRVAPHVHLCYSARMAKQSKSPRKPTGEMRAGTLEVGGNTPVSLSPIQTFKLP